MFKKLGIIIVVLAMVLSLCVFSTSATEETGKVIFIRDGGEGDGSSPEEALGLGDSGEAYADAPLYQAWEELKETGGTIVICGPYTLNAADASRTLGAPDIMMGEQSVPSWFRNPKVTITYTSVWDGVDYRQTEGAKLIFDDNNTSITFPTATVLKDITVVAGGNPGDNRDNYVCAGYNPLTLGKGTNFVANAQGELPVVIGGHRNYSSILGFDANTDITVDIGSGNTIGAIYGNLAYANKNQKGNAYITIKSGTVNGIYGDNQNNHGFGLTGAINITITGGTICGEVAATNGGIPVKNDGVDITPVVNMVISGGDFSNCTGIKATSDFFNNNCASNTAVQAPGAITVDCSKASAKTFSQVKLVCGLNLTAPSGDNTEPDPTDPPATTPKPTEPKPTEPQATEPKPTEPQATEPKPTEPKPTEPKPTEPKPTEPEATVPGATEPQATAPEATEPQATTPQAPAPAPADNSNLIYIVLIVAIVAAAAVAIVIILKRK
ncbi:MAG: hypothetical protein E7436_02240 [Ruminococcaceae bacterium]|nr:hypothetical protein [Oscillospiraceae bacterium]